VPLTGGPPAPTILLSACEPSADLHGARLMAALKGRLEGAAFVGIGGERMAAEGLEVVFPARELSVMGISEVLARLPVIRRAFRAVGETLARRRPDAVVIIDAPDFNLRVAGRARRCGVPVVYLVPPKVWAWRRGRLKTIRRRVDRVLAILPFEPPIYEAAGIPVTYVGNPLVDEMAEVRVRAPRTDGWRPEDLGIPPGGPLVALLPGSRPREIDHILPDLLAAARLLQGRVPDVRFALSAAGSLDPAPIRRAAAAAGVAVTLVEGRTPELLCAADAAAMASGTVTLQCALAGTPGVIVYRAAPLTYAIGSRLVRVPHFGLVNLVAGRRVMPELLQHAFTPEAVCGHLHALLTDPDAAGRQRQGIKEVQAALGAPGAAGRAADAVCAVMGRAA
jgi:lipid-A-disaccharide synthase